MVEFLLKHGADPHARAKGHALGPLCNMDGFAKSY